ncbi:MAG: substrate-binding domain-containing protein, partial [Alphaproteobacteria bacterium]|nr:substrate-binding domain-containing protein [Alphaproteobacteria bacterium]
MRKALPIAALLAGLLGYGTTAEAADVKVLTTGAMKEVVLAVVPAYEKETGNKVTVSNDTAGAIAKRIEGGEGFDLCVLTPGAIKELAEKGKFAAASAANVARVGVGVVV